MIFGRINTIIIFFENVGPAFTNTGQYIRFGLANETNFIRFSFDDLSLVQYFYNAFKAIFNNIETNNM